MSITFEGALAMPMGGFFANIAALAMTLLSRLGGDFAFLSSWDFFAGGVPVEGRFFTEGGGGPVEGRFIEGFWGGGDFFEGGLALLFSRLILWKLR